MSIPHYSTGPEPDGEAIAEVVRKRLNEVLHHDPPTIVELEEIARLQALLIAHIWYVEQRCRT